MFENPPENQCDISKRKKFLEALEEHILVFDGAMGTMIQNLGLEARDFGGEAFAMLSDMLVFSKPDAIRDIHLAYFSAGAHCVETNTFGASPLRLEEFDFSTLDTRAFQGIPENLDLTRLDAKTMAREMSRQGAKIAKKALEIYAASEEYDGRPLFVAGSLGPSNYVLSPTHAELKRGTWEQIAENFKVQVEGLLEGGADILLFETQQDVLELKAAVSGAKQAMTEKKVEVPIICQITVDATARMQIFGTDIHSAIVTMTALDIDVFGINCSIGPDLMEKSVSILSKFSPLPISVLPNAGLPENIDGKTVFPQSSSDLAGHLRTFMDQYGVGIVGGCCGTTPGHIRAIAEIAKTRKPKKREIPKEVWISGPSRAVRISGRSELIRIGERLNVRGSKKVREAVEHEGAIHMEALEEVAKEQMEDLGCEVLDLCMDSNIVQTKIVLPEVIRGLCVDFQGALCIDSFDAEALSAAIRAYPGRPVINSISMEGFGDESKADFICRHTAFHSPLYIALAADDEGPAQTREKKKAIADRLVATAARYGIPANQLFIDINAFPIGSESVEGLNFALESLEAIPLIKEAHPGIMTSIGVGNLTNGLAKKPYMRLVLTSVFLDEGKRRGLDAAIVNPNHYVPVESLDPGDYRLGLAIILNRDMDAYTDLEEIAEGKEGKKVEKRSSYEGFSPAETLREKIRDGFKKREKGEILWNGRKIPYEDAIVEDAAKALQSHNPLEIINDYLMDAMNILGERFSAGEVSLPHLLRAADVMKSVMGFLEDVMAEGRAEEKVKALIVMGTVYQDVHSIGKDLTRTLLENYGFKVIDLGVQVPVESFVEAAVREKADAIGMSALLVQTASHMISVTKLMKEKGLDIPVFVGGAPVNLRHAATVALCGETDLETIKPDVFYCRTAMDSVNVMEGLISEKRDAIIAENRKKLVEAFLSGRKRAEMKENLVESLPNRMVSFENHSSVTRYETRDFFPDLFEVPISEKGLFNLNWKLAGERKDGDKLLSYWRKRTADEGLIQLQGRIALFPANSDKGEIILFDPANPEREIARLETEILIGREKKDRFRVADFILPVSEGIRDCAGLQIATAGMTSMEAVERFKNAGDTESALMLQGLANRYAEDFAEYLHTKIRNLAGVEEKDGARYSPGYPGIPLSENDILYTLLKAEDLGVILTEAHGFLPLATTAALVVFYKDAGYA